MVGLAVGYVVCVVGINDGDWVGDVVGIGNGSSHLGADAGTVVTPSQ